MIGRLARIRRTTRILSSVAAILLIAGCTNYYEIPIETPIKPKLVAEVRFDHVTGGRFRHGTSFLRWRPDKAPRQCTFDQLR